jgi:hypothetical protein
MIAAIQVSVMAAELDAAVKDFRTRPLDAGPHTFVAADALVLKVRDRRSKGHQGIRGSPSHSGPRHPNLNRDTPDHPAAPSSQPPARVNDHDWLREWQHLGREDRQSETDIQVRDDRCVILHM